MDSPGFFTAPSPALRFRAVHLDLKGVPPTYERLLRLLEVFAAARFNAVLVEWEDMFPWRVDARFRCETAYTSQQISRFVAAAGALKLQIIPLVQCLGHMETPLSVPGYQHLREVPYRSDVLNPLAPGARDLVQHMVEDVLALLPGVKHFHLGGDEARTFGTHPDTKAYIAQHGKGALYLQHVEPILDSLLTRGIRPILWHDMMVDWDAPSLQQLAAKADLMVWAYNGHPDQGKGHCSTKCLPAFTAAGVRTWFAGAYKGADGHDFDLPGFAGRQANALGWMEVARRHEFVGGVATGWSRYTAHQMQVEPIDAALDCLVNVGRIFHDGAAPPPEPGQPECAAYLTTLGERERFEACRAALSELAEARRYAWTSVGHLRQHIIMATLDARRRSGHEDMQMLKLFRNALRNIQGMAGRVRHAFSGLVEPLWVERYLEERIAPLREELAVVETRIRLLNPQGFAAENP